MNKKKCEHKTTRGGYCSNCLKKVHAPLNIRIMKEAKSGKSRIN